MVTPGDPAPVDVIVPVYGAAADLAACLASVVRHTDLALHRVVVVLDGPDQPGVAAVLDSLGTDVRSLVVTANPVRSGYVVAVNRGLRAGEGDVVLLNSDTVVTAGWLGKLARAAHSDAAIATVTPFSNDATLASLPRPFASNLVPAGHDVDSFAQLVERAAQPSYPRVPTGVGSCLYVKRAVLTAIGPFDEAFSPGYGEETDFCLRAQRAGWVNVLDDATYVWHSGGRSFGAARKALLRRAERRVRWRHRGYWPALAAFMKADPLAPVRQRVLDALRPPPAAAPARPARVLHVVHGWPPFAHGGTEHYAAALARRQAARREVTVWARRSDRNGHFGDLTELHDTGVRVQLVTNDFTARNPLVRNALASRRLEAAFARLLDECRPDLVHVHHLAGHAASIVGVAALRRIAIVWQLQDWWPACARANMLPPSRRLCPGPAACRECLPLTRLPPAHLWNTLLRAYRGRLLRRALAWGSAWIAGSRFVADSYRALGLLPPTASVQVLPYGIEPVPARERRTATRPLRFGCVGTLMAHKGVHVAVAAFADVAATDATLDVWGGDSADPEYSAELRAAAGPAVRFRGPFSASQQADVFAGMDVLVVPSVGLESFGIVVREAFSAGVPVIASRRGALAEAIDDGRTGALYEAEDPQALRAVVARVVADPSLLGAWSLALPAVPSMDAHAEEIEAVYARVLAQHS